jgi:hypothetical protein
MDNTSVTSAEQSGGINQVEGPARIYSVEAQCQNTKERTITYVIQGPPVMGKFHPEKAVAQGVPPGPLFGRYTSSHVRDGFLDVGKGALQKGRNITLDNGVQVLSTSCMEASTRGKVNRYLFNERKHDLC